VILNIVKSLAHDKYFIIAHINKHKQIIRFSKDCLIVIYLSLSLHISLIICFCCEHWTLVLNINGESVNK